MSATVKMSPLEGDTVEVSGNQWISLLERESQRDITMKIDGGLQICTWSGDDKSGWTAKERQDITSEQASMIVQAFLSEKPQDCFVSIERDSGPAHAFNPPPFYYMPHTGLSEEDCVEQVLVRAILAMKSYENVEGLQCGMCRAEKGILSLNNSPLLYYSLTCGKVVLEQLNCDETFVSEAAAIARSHMTVPVIIQEPKESLSQINGFALGQPGSGKGFSTPLPPRADVER